MSSLRLVETPDTLLRMKSEPVSQFGGELKSFIDEMTSLMYEEDGAGISAVQVGVLKRIFIVDISDDRSSPIVFINPEIIHYSENKIALNEGCLSFPGRVRLMIERPETVKVKFHDYMGNQKEITADDWLSRAIQHENDHLNGVLLLDHVSKLKQDLFVKKVQKFQRSRDK